MYFCQNFIVECTDDTDCQETLACTGSTNGICVDPCITHRDVCNEDQACVVKSHAPSCLGILL